jgi:type IV secretion system protein VirB11
MILPSASEPLTTRDASTSAAARRPTADLTDLVAEMLCRYVGPVIVGAFADDDVTEIYVNPQDGHIRFDTRSRGRIDSGHEISAERLEMFLNAVASAHHTPLGPLNPDLQAELPMAVFGGARLQGFLPPVSGGPAIIIRKRPTTAYALDRYVDDGRLSPAWRAVLGHAVEARQTIIIAGGTGTGKSALLGALLHEIQVRRPDDRIVVLEDTVELRCPVPDHLALRTTPERSLAALVKRTLRASPTRIVIGEVRDHAALDFLDAAVTGHPGGLCTIHATTALDALARLDRLAQRAHVPPQAPLVAAAIDLVVVLEGDHRTRRVVDLVHVDGLTTDGQYVLHSPESFAEERG